MFSEAGSFLFLIPNARRVCIEADVEYPWEMDEEPAEALIKEGILARRKNRLVGRAGSSRTVMNHLRGQSSDTIMHHHPRRNAGNYHGAATAAPRGTEVSRGHSRRGLLGTEARSSTR